MKRLILPILSVWTLSLGSNSVFAVNGKITVNGAVTNGTWYDPTSNLVWDLALRILLFR